jgi:hypothetical protein
LNDEEVRGLESAPSIRNQNKITEMKGKVMSNKSERTEGTAQLATWLELVKRLGISTAVICFSLGNLAHAQTSLLCDPVGDANSSSGKGGPAIPAWLDITQSEIADDSTGDLLFTMTVNGSIPSVPAWSGVDDGGQLWWGWRMLNDLATASTVKNGCVVANGSQIPAAYFLDLIWSVQTSSFQARLLDDTSCTQVAVPFYFSPDRTQVTLVVSKASLSNVAIIPDLGSFQYLAVIESWKSNSTGNRSFSNLDIAPNANGNQLVVVNYSGSSDTSYLCP